jgi:glutaminyl-tRNA synthetase
VLNVHPITQVEEAVPLRPVPSAAPPSIFEEGFLANLHKPGDNPQQDPRLRREHLEATGGKVITRFPPEREFGMFI